MSNNTTSTDSTSVDWKNFSVEKLHQIQAEREKQRIQMQEQPRISGANYGKHTAVTHNKSLECYVSVTEFEFW